jgi:hypothetical protein
MGRRSPHGFIGLGVALAAGPTDGGAADGSLEFAGAVVSTEIERTKQIITTIRIRIATSASRLSVGAIFRKSLFIDVLYNKIKF